MLLGSQQPRLEEAPARGVKWRRRGWMLVVMPLAGFLVWGLVGLRLEWQDRSIVTCWNHDPNMRVMRTDGFLAVDESLIYAAPLRPVGRSMMLIVGDYNYQVNICWARPDGR